MKHFVTFFNKALKQLSKPVKKFLKVILAPFSRIKKELWFYKTLFTYKKLNKNRRFPALRRNFFKCLDDNTKNTGFDAHYEYHQAWAARCLAKIQPEKHIDISSKITFNVTVSAFIPIDFYDFRPAKIYGLDNLNCKQADLTNLHFEDNSIESISCMHTLEHIGLGRYGDRIDPDGDIKAMNELARVTSRGGNLLIVVPVGRPRVQFNAHRIYSYDMILEQFKGFELVEFALIPDNAMDLGIIYGASKELTNAQTYACGCFWFRKNL